MQKTQSFLGSGWAFPPTFTRGGAEIEMASGPEDIHQSLQILLSTQMGERVMHEDYGCDMTNLVFEEIDQGLINSLNSMISNAILLYEPRIKLDGLDISIDDAQEGLLLIALEYTIRSTNSRYNMVYPFYINEASIPI